MRYLQHLLRYCIFTHHKSLYSFILKVFTIVAICSYSRWKNWHCARPTKLICGLKMTCWNSSRKASEGHCKNRTLETSTGHVWNIPECVWTATRCCWSTDSIYFRACFQRRGVRRSHARWENISASRAAQLSLCVWERMGKEGSALSPAVRAVFSFDCGFQSAVCCAWLSSGWSCQRK